MRSGCHKLTPSAPQTSHLKNQKKKKAEEWITARRPTRPRPRISGPTPRPRGALADHPRRTIAFTEVGWFFRGGRGSGNSISVFCFSGVGSALTARAFFRRPWHLQVRAPHRRARFKCLPRRGFLDFSLESLDWMCRCRLSEEKVGVSPRGALTMAGKVGFFLVSGFFFSPLLSRALLPVFSPLFSLLRGALLTHPPRSQIFPPLRARSEKRRNRKNQASSSARGGTRRWTGGCSSQEATAPSRAGRRRAAALAPACCLRRRCMRSTTARPRPSTAAGPRTTLTPRRGSTTSTRSGSTRGKGNGEVFFLGWGERKGEALHRPG